MVLLVIVSKIPISTLCLFPDCHLDISAKFDDKQLFIASRTLEEVSYTFLPYAYKL